MRELSKFHTLLPRVSHTQIRERTNFQIKFLLAKPVGAYSVNVCPRMDICVPKNGRRRRRRRNDEPRLGRHLPRRSASSRRKPKPQLFNVTARLLCPRFAPAPHQHRAAGCFARKQAHLKPCLNARPDNPDVFQRARRQVPRRDGAGRGRPEVRQVSFVQQYAVDEPGLLAEHAHDPVCRGQSELLIVAEPSRGDLNNEVFAAGHCARLDARVIHQPAARVERAKVHDWCELHAALGELHEAARDGVDDVGVGGQRALDLREVEDRHSLLAPQAESGVRYSTVGRDGSLRYSTRRPGGYRQYRRVLYCRLFSFSGVLHVEQRYG